MRVDFVQSEFCSMQTVILNVVCVCVCVTSTLLTVTVLIQERAFVSSVGLNNQQSNGP